MLDRLYTPAYNILELNQKAYFIHGYSVGSDHSSVQVEVSIGSGEVRKTACKWNVTYLKEEFADKLKENWDNLPTKAFFFHKL